MTKDRKILIIVVLISILSHIILVFHYESKLKPDENEVTIVGGFDKNKKYSAEEIITLIKEIPEYIGDSVTIFKDGTLGTNNPKFQGTITSVSKNDKASLDQQVQETGFPFSYLVYKLAATYYRQQYPNEFKKDTLNIK